MMYLQKISLVNFKNIEAKSFEFQEKINCFVGNNGVGKTNILDAIYCLSFTKSYFNSVAGQNIKHNEDFFMIQGEYLLEERPEKILYSLKRGEKKVLKRNGKLYEKFSEHIGQFPLVIISPADSNLISEGSESRRKFIDGVIAQQDKAYLNDLIAYHKILGQRNSLLKYFASNHTFDALNLQIYDAQLLQYGDKIHQKRKVFLAEFAPIFIEKYQLISKQKEQVNLSYKSQLSQYSMANLLTEAQSKDRVLQYTSVGVHKDDLNFEIAGYPIKKFGSQGQQKSYLIALKLAQFEFIRAQRGTIPILLLDDIFDKLDPQRVSQLIHLVNGEGFGQIFITDTHAERTERVIRERDKPYQIFKLD